MRKCPWVDTIGAHTFGQTRCITFRDCLYDFGGSGNPDADLDARYL